MFVENDYFSHRGTASHTTQTLHLEVDSRLQQVDDPGGVLQDKLVAVKCTADHLELHVRGVTAEP